eukprot:COSAG02_NODE_12916_length_1472_cov_18.304443_3_plen_41_part_01
MWTDPLTDKLHKSAIYGKADHIIALLDAGADPSLRTEHDPT